MAFQLPEGMTLFDFVNVNMSKLMGEVSRLQVYINDWPKLPDDFKNMAKSELSTFLDNTGTFLDDLKQYISTL